jgi:hypothetical protein
MAKKKFIIDLKLNSIKIKDITTDLEGDYHIYAACTTGYATCHKWEPFTGKIKLKCKSCNLHISDVV